MSWGRAEYVEAYEGGASIDEIAMIAGKSYSTIHYHLKKAGVEIRPQGKTNKESTDHTGHEFNAAGQCKTCKTKQARDRYQNDPEFRERRQAAHRRYMERKRNEDA